MNPQIERRTFTTRLEVREDPMDGTGPLPVITGHAAVFDALSEEFYGGWFERIAPGAFRSSVDDDVRALFNHNPDLILGRTSSGTLEIEEDDLGLSYKIYPPRTTIATDLLVSIQRGDITQSSFAFVCLDDEWEMEGGIVIRTVNQVKLYDVSPVTYPAYSNANDVTANAAEKVAEVRAKDERKQGRTLIDVAALQTRARLARLRRMIALESEI